MVGHRGIEPRNTCVSGRSLRPAGSWPAEGGGVDPPGVTLRGLSRPGAAPAAHLPGAESGELESHGVTRALVSSEARPPWPVHSPCPTRDSNSEPLPSGGSASTKLG